MKLMYEIISVQKSEDQRPELKTEIGQCYAGRFIFRLRSLVFYQLVLDFHYKTAEPNIFLRNLNY